MKRSNAEKRHDYHVNKLCRQTSIIHPEKPYWKTTHFEYNLEDIVGELDLMFYNKSGVHIVEYKSSTNQFKKAQEQLLRANEFLERSFETSATGLYMVSYNTRKEKYVIVDLLGGC